jgi:hypothetical protein
MQFLSVLYVEYLQQHRYIGRVLVNKSLALGDPLPKGTLSNVHYLMSNFETLTKLI